MDRLEDELHVTCKTNYYSFKPQLAWSPPTDIRRVSKAAA